MAFVDKSNSSGGNTTSTYATIADEHNALPNARQLVAGANVTLTDGGAGSTLTIASTGGGGGGSGADPGASFVLIANTSSLGNERALAVGSGLTLADGGANASVTVGINNGVVATISGSRFSGVVAYDPSGVQSIGTDVGLYVSGSTGVTAGANRKVALFGGGVFTSGSVHVFASNNGSLVSSGSAHEVGALTFRSSGSGAAERGIVETWLHDSNGFSKVQETHRKFLQTNAPGSSSVLVFPIAANETHNFFIEQFGVTGSSSANARIMSSYAFTVRRLNSANVAQWGITNPVFPMLTDIPSWSCGFTIDPVNNVVVPFVSQSNTDTINWSTTVQHTVYGGA